MKKRISVVLILVFAFFGLADSVYLTQQKLSGTPLLCDIQDLSGCNIVAASQYSSIFGIPLSEFGVLFYGVLFLLAALELVIFDRLLRRILQVAALIGILSSLYFTFLQIFVINAFCIYCFVSAFITFVIFILAGLIEPIRKRARLSPPPLPPEASPHFPMPPAA